MTAAHLPADQPATVLQLGTLPPSRVTSCHPAEPPACGRQRQSDRSQCFLVHDQPDLTAQKVKQHGNALTIGHSFKQPEAGREHAVDDANGITRRKPRLPWQTDKTVFVLAPLNSLNDLAGNRRWLSPAVDKVGDAESRPDRPPPLRCKVKRDKQVAREEWCCDRLDPPRVPSAFQVTRQIAGKALAIEIQCRLRFSTRVCVYHIPPRGRVNDHVGVSPVFPV